MTGVQTVSLPIVLDLAETRVEKKTAPFKPGPVHDRYVVALRDLIERKRKSKGAKIDAEEEEEAPSRGSNVIDLMAALKKSIDKPSGASGRKETAKKTPAKKAAPARKRA